MITSRDRLTDMLTGWRSYASRYQSEHATVKRLSSLISKIDKEDDEGLMTNEQVANIVTKEVNAILRGEDCPTPWNVLKEPVPYLVCIYCKEKYLNTADTISMCSNCYGCSEYLLVQPKDLPPQ